ncbi:GNAT family N-acetyltransferase [Paenibacillus chitinolyticus]
MKEELRELNLEEGSDIFEMTREIGLGANGFVNSFYSETRDEFYNLLLKNYNMARAKQLPEGLVPQTVYWLYADGRPVGYGKMRHALNGQLKKRGGHIGYVIRPTERGKGYAKLLLQLLLREAAVKGIREALLTCNEDNAPSRRVIESCGGVLQDTIDGICRYHVPAGRVLGSTGT